MTEPDPVHENTNQDEAMPLVAHLTELRDRLLRSILAVLLVFIGLFYFANDIYTYVSAPLRQLMPSGTSMIATEVASPFLAPFKLTMVVALFVAMPYILHQTWRFIAPALYRSERRLAVPILLSSVLLFYAGLAFAYYAVFPLIFAFFTSVTPDGVAIMTDINSYLNFVLKLFFAFGIAFEIPVATVLLISAQVTTVEALAAKRPYVVVVCFIVGMLLTPPDIISQTLLAVPVWLLFEAGLFFGSLIQLDAQTQGD
jgi:sec-independent protein translocase protein TatC